MLNKKMNEAMSTLSAMSFEEKMLYMSLCFEEAIMDKDYLMGKDLDDEVPCIVTCNSGVQKPKNFNRKYALRDKAKHGYHNGSKKEGYGRYDMWLKPEKLAKDVDKDIKAQLFAEEYEDVTIDEMVYGIFSVLYENMPNSYESIEKFVFYRNTNFFVNWQSNCEQILNMGNMFKTQIQEMIPQFYEVVDALYPDTSMNDRNTAVNALMERLNEEVDDAMKFGINYIKNGRKMDLNAELDKLNMLYNI